jgi:hypothetical protein
VQDLKTLVVALGVTLWLPMSAQSADQPVQPDEAAAAPPKCLKAVVNPVTGYAICVEPRGAPVDPPPTASFNRPCKPRAHDGEAWTVYEHYSGCHD